MPRKHKCSICGNICFSKSEIKLCRECSLSERNKNRPSTKEYRREWRLIKKYGIDNKGFDLLWQVFQGKCGICKCDLTLPTNTIGQKLSTACVDHDHKTGNIRGLLCNACNKGIGLLKDDPSVLKSAMNWVSVHV